MNWPKRELVAALHSRMPLENGASDADASAIFDQITVLAASLFDAPAAFVSLYDAERQWFKSGTGPPTPREEAFCAHALLLDPRSVLVVENAASDARFADNIHVTGPDHIRFYAGALLTDRRGRNLGTLCLIDTEPRARPSDVKLARLQLLAKLVVNELERVRADRRLAEQARLLSMAESISSVGHWRYQVKSGRVFWSDEVYRIHGVDRDVFDPNYDQAAAFYHEDDQPVLNRLVQRAIHERGGFELELRIRRADGEVRTVVSKATSELDDCGEVEALFGVFQDVTDQNRALQDVRTSEARYRLLADNAADVIILIGLDGCINYVSPSLRTLLGYEPSEMVGSVAGRLVYELDRRAFVEALAALSAGQEDATVQARAADRQGRPVWVETRIRLVRDARGRPHELVAVMRDISERKALESETLAAHDAAREKARRALLAEQLAGLGYWRMDAQDATVVWSDLMYRIYDLAPETQISAELLTRLTHPDDLAESIARIDAALTGKVLPGPYVVRVFNAQGDVRHLAADIDIELSSDGCVAAVIGTVMDVTAQAQAKIALETSEANYRLLAESAHDVILKSDPVGRLIYVSPSVQAAMGYLPEELIGASALQLVHPEDVDEIVSAVRAQRESRGREPPRRLEYRARCKDGSEIWMEGRPTVVLDPQTGRMAGHTDVVRDITDRKALEAALNLAREQAELAAAAKSEFLANMSHELRTPLTSIIGFTDLVMGQSDLPETARRYVERVENASRGLLCTVNDILDFSKLEAGQVTMSPTPTDVVQLCRATLDLMGPQAAAKDLELHLDLDALHPREQLWVQIDPDRIRQVLLNLVGNAVKFTAQGAVMLQLSYVDERLAIAVKDTGLGIPASKLGRLFQRFSQIDGSLTRSHGGTGLGLAICKGLVEAMGGDIGAESVPGYGSRFWFTAPAPLADAVAPKLEAEAAQQLTFSGLRVLVADDHPTNRELARLFLSGAGAEVSEVQDGEAAVTIAGKHPFDVILMDVRMPTLDGPSALRLIRATAGPNDATPILAYTAEATRDDAARLIALGFDDVVSKPVQPAALLAAVARAVVFMFDDAADSARRTRPAATHQAA